MSGPKIIDYQAIERQRAEAARRRWRALAGRAQALEQRCVRAGHPDCAVRVGAAPGSTSDELERHCDQLARMLADAAQELERRQFADRTREVASGLHDILADLERREQRAARTVEPEVRQQSRASEPSPTRTVDFAEKVSRRLASLTAPSADLERAARAVLAETDHARARLLYDDLDQRISRANHDVQVRIERLAEIAELRAQLDALTDPEPLRVLLDQAAQALDRGEDVQGRLQQARGAVTDQLDAAASAADRAYVRRAVADSLAELGYGVADVDVQTPETLIFQQSGTHGVRADIRDGEIAVHTVRWGATDSTADRDAEEEFCARVPGFLAAMARRGVSAGVKEQALPGLYQPETVALRTKRGGSNTQQDQQQSTTRRRTAR